MSTAPAALAAPAAPAAPAAHAQPTAPETLPYAYSTGNAFASFPKFNGNYFAWHRNMETELKALRQWEIIDGSITAPTPTTPATPTPEEARH